MPDVSPLSRVKRLVLAKGGRLTKRVEAVFAGDGALARALPDFEPRAAQLNMARAVAGVFEEGGVLLAEAGTGTGKTLAYLVPAIVSGERVLVSTGTKNLQEQIYFKDIPALRDALGIQFTASYMKGRANYLCLHKLDQLNDSFGLSTHDVFLPMIREWATTTETGDRAELEGLPEELPFWTEVAATSETCLGTECSRYEDCFVTKMRQRAAAADVVIVNHHLLCADAAVRKSAYGEVIPACSRAILDEAHQLEEVATQYFGVSVSNYRLEELARDVERFAVTGVDDRSSKHEIAKAVERLRDHGRQFFNALGHAHRRESRLKSEERVRANTESLADIQDQGAHLGGALEILQATLALLDKRPTNDGDKAEDASAAIEQIAALVRRSGEIRDELRFMLRAADDEFVYFVEFRARGIFLRAAPIDVSSILREVLFERMTTMVLTSATLTVDGTFDYFRDRLGVRNGNEVRFASEFDFARQTILYLPRRMPDPRSQEFLVAAAREVIEILRRTEGRAFVLFTSYASMRAVQAMAEMAVHYPIYAQGTAPRTQLLKQFRETANAVLFATSSFWQGVDVIGDALSCVIIDKLPFASPSDPVTSARIEAIRARGGDPFGEYQVPLAILTLQQGLGRLIRHRRDRGVLAVLDPRLRTKGYGRRFVASLPPAPVVYDLERVRAFFASEA